MGIKGFARELVSGMLDLWFPPHCEGCGVPIEDAGQVMCNRCRDELPLIHVPRCRQCSFPFDGQMEDLPEFDCHNCRERRFAFACCVAPFRFRNPIRQMVLDLKYHGQTRLARPLGDWLAQTVATDTRLDGHPIDGLVPAPLHPVRQRERGYNQAQLLSEQVFNRLGIPILPALKRVRYTSTQTIRDRRERMENLRGAFELRKGTEVRGKVLLVVDDVFTTGSTIQECARVLRKAGAREVFAATVARG